MIIDCHDPLESGIYLNFFFLSNADAAANGVKAHLEKKVLEFIPWR